MRLRGMTGRSRYKCPNKRQSYGCRFRIETEDDSLQPTIDMLLNISVFMWYGAVAPWALFRVNDVIPIYRLIFLAVLILIFRRLPMVLLFHKFIHEIEELQQALFVGFFGPIGVSAVFYLYVSLDFLDHVLVDGEVREDAARLQDVMRVVIWFLAISSIVVHGKWCYNSIQALSCLQFPGLSVPLGKLGYRMPRTISQALSSENEQGHSNLDLRRLQDPSSYLRRRKRTQEPRTELPSTATFVLGNRSAGEPSRPVRIINSSPGVSGIQTPEQEGLVGSQNAATGEPSKDV